MPGCADAAVPESAVRYNLPAAHAEAAHVGVAELADALG